jgi:hypothetical protein
MRTASIYALLAVFLLVVLFACDPFYQSQITYEIGTPPAGPPADALQVSVASAYDAEGIEVVDHNLPEDPEVTEDYPGHFTLDADVTGLPPGFPVQITVEFDSHHPVDDEGCDIIVEYVQFSSGPLHLPPTYGPRFALRVEGLSDLVLDVQNIHLVPITINALEGVTLATPLSNQGLTYTSLNSLGLVTLLGNTPLNPFQLVTVDIPEEDFLTSGTLATGAFALRFTSSMFGQSMRAVWQGTPETGPVSVESTTWGAIKALYRQPGSE